MPSRAWAASGSKRPPGSRQTERAFGSWERSIGRARAAWDDLAGRPEGGRYSDAAAAAILRTALGLWADTAAGMGDGDPLG